MIRVNKNNVIEMTRGDTLLVRVVPTRAGAPYVPIEGDSIRFALKSNKMDYAKTKFKDTTPLVLKNVPLDTLLLRLDPEDTKELPFGEYIYDVQLTQADGFVSTFVANTRFKLCEEVD